MNAFAERIRRIIADELDIDIEDVRPDANFARDLGADSMDYVQLAMIFEGEFNIAISDSEFATLATVGDAIAFLARRTGYTERADA